MMASLFCFLFGHKRYRPQALREKPIRVVRDAMGELLCEEHICERCMFAYWEWGE